MNEKNNEEKKKKRKIIIFIILYFILITILHLFLFTKFDIFRTDGSGSHIVIISDDYKISIGKYISKLMKSGREAEIKDLLLDLGVSEKEVNSIIKDKDKIVDKIFEIVKNDASKSDEILDKLEELVDEIENDKYDVIINTSKDLNIEFSNINVDQGSVSNATTTLINNTMIDYNIYLSRMNDFYSFTVDITNNSSMDAKIDNIKTSLLSEKESKILKYICSYADNGISLKKGDILKSGETKKIRFYVVYNNITNSEDLPKNDVKVNYNWQISYVQN